MNRFHSFTIILLTLLASVAPGAAQSLAPAPDASPADSSATPPPKPGGTSPESVTADSYVLRPNDLIRISVFQEDDLLTEARISKLGYINFPLIGTVHLAGRTVGDGVAEIRARLDKDYVINPQVTLTMLEYAEQWVTVLGEVQKPGQVQIPPEGGLDLLGAIALAGGYTRVADPSCVIVRRQGEGHDVVLKVNAKKLAKDAQVEPFLVQPGDRINVAESIW
jgi:polysaccharide export outer membrane protein